MNCDARELWKMWDEDREKLQKMKPFLRWPGFGFGFGLIFVIPFSVVQQANVVHAHIACATKPNHTKRKTNTNNNKILFSVFFFLSCFRRWHSLENAQIFASSLLTVQLLQFFSLFPPRFFFLVLWGLWNSSLFVLCAFNVTNISSWFFFFSCILHWISFC